MHPIFHTLYLYIKLFIMHFYVFRLSSPVTFKKSYLSNVLGYLHTSFSIGKLMTCSQIIIFVK